MTFWGWVYVIGVAVALCHWFITRHENGTEFGEALYFSFMWPTILFVMLWEELKKEK